MPYKSEAQRRYFYAQAGKGGKKGKKWKKMAGEWESKTPKNKKLPERIGESFEHKLSTILDTIFHIDV